MLNLFVMFSRFSSTALAFLFIAITIINLVGCQSTVKNATIKRNDYHHYQQQQQQKQHQHQQRYQRPPQRQHVVQLAPPDPTQRNDQLVQGASSSLHYLGLPEGVSLEKLLQKTPPNNLIQFDLRQSESRPVQNRIQNPIKDLDIVSWINSHNIFSDPNNNNNANENNGLNFFNPKPKPTALGLLRQRTLKHLFLRKVLQDDYADDEHASGFFGGQHLRKYGAVGTAGKVVGDLIGVIIKQMIENVGEWMGGYAKDLSANGFDYFMMLMAKMLKV